jgi:hypothetical protein
LGYRAPLRQNKNETRAFSESHNEPELAFYLHTQPIDAALGKSNGQVLIVAMDVYVPKEVKKGKIMAKKRTNAAKVDLGTLLEDLVMVDASDGTTGVTADGTGDTTPPPPGESATVTTTTPPPGDAAMDTTAPPGAAAMDTTTHPAPPGHTNL